MATDKQRTGLHTFRQIYHTAGVQNSFVCTVRIWRSGTIRWVTQAAQPTNDSAESSAVNLRTRIVTCVRHSAPHSVEENVIRVMKWRRMRLARRATHTGENKKAYSFWLGP